MATYFNRLIEEKGLSREYIFEVEGTEWGTNYIALGVVVDYLNQSDANTQKVAEAQLTKIDFHNGDVLDFFQYVAKFLSI